LGQPCTKTPNPVLVPEGRESERGGAKGEADYKCGKQAQETTRAK